MLPSNYEIQVYALMGRSENSRNRKFVYENNIVRTAPIDPAKVKDQSLIIYNAMREWRGRHMVTNGDQTDTVYYALEKFCPDAFQWAMDQRTFEPDLPNYTPRISAMSHGSGKVEFGVLSRSPYGECERVIYEFRNIPPGYGYCVHTYAGDGDPLPAFIERPFLVPLGGNTLEEIANHFWKILNRDNRVALVGKLIDTPLNKSTVHIIPKN